VVNGKAALCGNVDVNTVLLFGTAVLQQHAGFPPDQLRTGSDLVLLSAIMTTTATGRYERHYSCFEWFREFHEKLLEET